MGNQIKKPAAKAPKLVASEEQQETAKLASEEQQETAKLYYEQVNNITITCHGGVVNVHVNQSGEPKNEPPKGGG